MKQKKCKLSTTCATNKYIKIALFSVIDLRWAFDQNHLQRYKRNKEKKDFSNLLSVNVVTGYFFKITLNLMLSKARHIYYMKNIFKKSLCVLNNFFFFFYLTWYVHFLKLKINDYYYQFLRITAKNFHFFYEKKFKRFYKSF